MAYVSFFSRGLEFEPLSQHIIYVLLNVINYMRCPTKIKTFLWKALHDGLSVFRRLKSRFPSVSYSCPRCNENGESVLYCLVTCPFAIEVWSQLGFSLPANSANPLPFWLWFLTLLDDVQRKPQRRQRASLGATALWKLWLEQNQVVFEHSSSTPTIVSSTTMDLNLEFHRYHPHELPPFFSIPNFFSLEINTLVFKTYYENALVLKLFTELPLFCQGDSWFVFAAVDWEVLKRWAPFMWRRGSVKRLQCKRRQHQKRNHKENHFGEGASHVDYGKRKSAPSNVACQTFI
ncbi:hypothetical protein PIB30_020098 [Stylosanthes scabra]|uniref:Reverse transcriptase zinc-binding domain-containing protein n=1 Tax=Stylosanthes scabra TaxID=79078 RepID=A0ABU6W9G6_9FABA|nr:hypothetical protein [Stylosanthes scabra]